MMDEGASQKLRQRRTESSIPDKDEPDEGKFSKALKRYDAYARVDSDVVVTSNTGSGLTLSIVTWILVIILSLNEFATYWAKMNVRVEHLAVDTSLGQQVKIELNITFWALDCTLVHLCAMDVAGENHLFIDDDMSKQRLNSKGNALGKPVKVSANSKPSSSLTHRTEEDYCGPCYKVEKYIQPDEKGRKCCNTCNELVDAYNNNGFESWYALQESEQCSSEFMERLYADYPKEDNEGCNLCGSLLVNKVAGNLHVAMGESRVKGGQHIHLFDYRSSDSFNISHTIHNFSFGASYPDKPPDALNGMVQILDKNVGTGLMQYYVNVIPTLHNEAVAESNMVASSHYTYTVKFKSIYGYEMVPNLHPDASGKEYAMENYSSKAKGKNRENHPNVMPGVFFIYDISPFVLSILNKNSMPFAHLIIRLCAISGGVVTISRLLESVFGVLVVYIAKKRVFLP